MDITSLSDADLLSALGKQPSGLSAMSDADLLKAIGKQPENVNTVADVAKSGGIGLAKGAIGLAGLPADLASLAAHGADYLTGGNVAPSVDQYVKPLGAENIQKKIEGYTGEFYKPKTTAGEYAQTAGEFAPALAGGPETLLTKLATRVAAPAAVSETAGQLTKGTPLEPYARVGGAVVGAGLPVAISRAISPTTIDAANAGAIKTLANEGVDLTAGQKSGSKTIKYMESELGDALGAGGKATAASDRQAEQFTAAALNKVPVLAGEKRLTQDVFDAGLQANSAKFDAVINRNPAISLQNNFMLPIQNVADDFKLLHGTGAAPILDNLVQKINSVVTQTPRGPVIPGQAYQALQSDIARYARSATNNGYLRNALYDMRGELQAAVSRGLNGRDAREFAAARNEYRKLLVMERAVSGTPEAAARGLVTPAALANAEKAVYGRRTYGRGTGPFSQLANAGNAMLKPLPQSGTAPRAAARLAPAAVGAGVGAGLGGLAGIAGGIAGPAVLGRLLMSGVGQKLLANQAAVPLRQIPAGKNALKGGLLAALQSRQ